MTYTATRYTRTPGRMHGCPDAYRDQWGNPSHYLAPEPGQDDPTRFVCPLELDQERSEAHAARVTAEREAAQKARAAEIAAQHFPYDGSEPDTVTECRRRTEAAIMQALAETENAQ